MDFKAVGTSKCRAARFGQFMLQAPGPRGSPHEPQADGPFAGAAARVGVPCDTANTENCLSKASDWHAGHFAWREALTMASNGWWQSRQTYSKIGMV